MNNSNHYIHFKNGEKLHFFEDEKELEKFKEWFLNSQLHEVYKLILYKKEGRAEIPATYYAVKNSIAYIEE